MTYSSSVSTLISMVRPPSHGTIRVRPVVSNTNEVPHRMKPTAVLNFIGARLGNICSTAGQCANQPMMTARPSAVVNAPIKQGSWRNKRESVTTGEEFCSGVCVIPQAEASTRTTPGKAEVAGRTHSIEITLHLRPDTRKLGA